MLRYIKGLLLGNPGVYGILIYQDYGWSAMEKDYLVEGNSFLDVRLRYKKKIQDQGYPIGGVGRLIKVMRPRDNEQEWARRTMIRNRGPHFISTTCTLCGGRIYESDPARISISDGVQGLAHEDCIDEDNHL